MENSEQETKFITAYAYAKKHKVAWQLIYARIESKNIPVNESGLIAENFPFKRRLKPGRKKAKKA